MTPQRICQLEGCTAKYRCSGYCSRHYSQALAGKLPLLKRPVWQTPKQLIESRVRRNPNNSCWEWQGHLNNGYGVIRYNGRRMGAHRFSYETFIGPIPEGLHIDHLCRNPPCVNPQHLEPVTIGENSRRGVLYPSLRGIRGCRKHGMQEGYVMPRTGKSRKQWCCLVCRRERSRRYKARKRAERAATQAA